MTVSWVVEKEIFPKPIFDKMLTCLASQGIPAYPVELKSHTHEIVGNTPRIEGPVIIYGSIGARDLVAHYGWAPGVWTNSDFDELTLNERLGSNYLNQGIVGCLFKNVLANVGDEPFFIKPNTDTKEFAGKIFFSKEEFTEWYIRQTTSGYLGEYIYDTQVVVGKPSTIGTEWRIVIVEGEPITGSIYRQYQQQHRKEDLPLHVADFARKIASIHSPCDVFVMDICETFDGLKVIEYNSFNCSGLYQCNLDKIVKSVTAYVNDHWNSIT